MDEPEYQPLTPLTTMGLHEGRKHSAWPDGGWFACERPEARPDGRTTWDWRCPKCVLAASMSVLVDGDADIRWVRKPGVPAESKKMSWMVARSLYWFDQPSIM